MSLVISVKFIAGTYSGHAETHSSYPPSPGRLLAALVAAAARDVDPDAADVVVKELAAAESPHIVTPPAFFSGQGESFMAGPKSVEAGRNASAGISSGAQRIFGETGGKIQKHVNGHYAVTGDLHFLWPTLQLTPESLEMLTKLCSDIPYLGRECDLTLVQAGQQSAASFREKNSDTHVVYAPSPAGGIQLRSASLAYLDWLNERHESMFGEHGREPIAEDHRVRLEAYAATVPVADGRENLLCLPFSRPINLDEALKYVPMVNGGTARSSFILARAGNKYLDGAAVGLGVFTESGIELAPEFDRGVLGMDTGAASLQPSYWTRPAQYWMTSVPYIAHPDKWVASQQILAKVPNAEIIEISSSPIRPSQQRMKADSKHRAWHIALRTSERVAGPLLLDEKTGTGVLMPDYAVEGTPNEHAKS